MNEYKYTDEDYIELEKAYDSANMICNGRPDQFQYHQNQLSYSVAIFLLKPYWYKKQNEGS